LKMSNTDPTDRISKATFYHRDPTVPFWRFNVDADALFEAHAHRPDRAQAWLRHRNVSESCPGFVDAVMMRGHFEGGILSNHAYHWTFTPGHNGCLAIVVPVVHDYRLVDFAAMSRHDHTVWGCCTGVGQYLGVFTSPFRVHRTVADWLANDCDGILPLSKTFLPLLGNAPKIIAEDDDHAWELAYRVFIDPAATFGGDQHTAEALAYNCIEVQS
jgi:hypothetical protein